MKIQYLFFFLILFFACKKNQLLQKQDEVKSSKVKTGFKDGVMYGRKERMPVLKTCYDKDAIWKDIKKCSDEKLLGIIYSNLKIPKEANCSFSKTVIIQFRVELDGSISNIQFPRKEKSCFQKEAKRLVGLLPEWLPANTYVGDVAVNYILPIKFNSESKQ